MKIWLLFFAVIVFAGCGDTKTTGNVAPATDTLAHTIEIGAMLDSFNRAAALAAYDQYFDFFTPNAVFIGTDATEHWTKEAYMKWAKPYFDKKTTWNFTSIQRNIYFSNQPGIAWFDELLNTQMKLCRGSGVVVKENGKWKLQQYVLSMTIPNEKIDEVLKAKSAIEDSLTRAIQLK